MKQNQYKSTSCRSNPRRSKIVQRFLMLILVAATGYGMATLTSSCANKDPGSIADGEKENDACANGCFLDGVCQTPSANTCGTGGRTCEVCASGQNCSGGSCVAPVTNFDPDGNGNTGNQPNTGDSSSTTDPSECAGCVDATGTCIAITNENCGPSGVTCSSHVDCTATDQLCGTGGTCVESAADKTFKITVQARADGTDDVTCDRFAVTSSGCDPEVELKSGGTTVTPWDESKNEKSDRSSIRFDDIGKELKNPAGIAAGLGKDFSNHFWCLKGSDISSTNLKITVGEMDLKPLLTRTNEDTCEVIVGSDGQNNPAVSSEIPCSGKDDVDIYIKLNVSPSDCTP